MFHLFHGQDTYSQRETLAALLAKEGDPDMVSLNTTRLGNRITFAELQSACDAMPFLSRVRVVLVDDLFSSGPDKALMEKLETYLPQLPKTTRLVFLESQSLSDSHRIIRLAQEKKIGYVRKFEQPRGGDLERWVRTHVEARGGRIAPQAAALLATNVGGDLQALTNEIEKLVLYKGSEATIEAADVVLLSPLSLIHISEPTRPY